MSSFWAGTAFLVIAVVIGVATYAVTPAALRRHPQCYLGACFAGYGLAAGVASLLVVLVNAGLGVVLLFVSALAVLIGLSLLAAAPYRQADQNRTSASRRG